MQTTFKSRNITWITLLNLLMLIALAYYVYLGFFVRPMADDYGQIGRVLEADPVGVALDISRIMNTSRYGMLAFLGVWGKYLGVAGVQILLLICVPLLFSTYLWIVRQLNHHFSRVPPQTTITIALALTLAICFSTPDLQPLYWYSGVVAYMVSIILLNATLAITMVGLKQRQLSRWLWVISTLLVITGAWYHETIAMLLFLWFTLVGMLQRRPAQLLPETFATKSKKRFIVVLWVISLICVVLVLAISVQSVRIVDSVETATTTPNLIQDIVTQVTNFALFSPRNAWVGIGLILVGAFYRLTGNSPTSTTRSSPVPLPKWLGGIAIVFQLGLGLYIFGVFQNIYNDTSPVAQFMYVIGVIATSFAWIIFTYQRRVVTMKIFWVVLFSVMIGLVLLDIFSPRLPHVWVLYATASSVVTILLLLIHLFHQHTHRIAVLALIGILTLGIALVLTVSPAVYGLGHVPPRLLFFGSNIFVLLSLGFGIHLGTILTNFDPANARVIRMSMIVFLVAMAAWGILESYDRTEPFQSFATQWDARDAQYQVLEDVREPVVFYDLEMNLEDYLSVDKVTCRIDHHVNMGLAYWYDFESVIADPIRC